MMALQAPRPLAAPKATKLLPRIVAPASEAYIPGVSIGVTVPATPAPATSPNGGHKLKERMAARADLRKAARLATINVLNSNPARPGGDEPAFPLGTYLRVKVTVAWGKGRAMRGREDGPLDDDNVGAMMKGAIDGFASALEIDDSWFQIETVEQVRDQAGLGWTRIVAEVIDSE